MEFKTLKRLFKQIGVVLILISNSFVVQAKIILVDGFVRAMPPTVPNTAAYFTLKNTGEAVNLIAVETEVARKAELHTLIDDKDLIKMRQVKEFSINANKTLKLTPSADHVMLLGLKKPLKIGQQVQLNLIFDKGQKLTINLPIQKSQSSEMSHHHH